MPLPEAIAEKIDTFTLHRSTYASAQYNETLLRDDFLDPFFRELGWDLTNTASLSHAYRDVVKEEALATKDGIKAPDFTFRIGGARKFFVEAKRPSVQIHTGSSAAYQLRRYAWNAKLPLSILTSFQEFAVYDGRVRPDEGDPASKARVFYCKFDELDEHWDWIASTFSKAAVLGGSLESWVEVNKARRGHSTVDSEFLATIEGWRTDLAKSLAKRNPSLTERDVNFSVQRIIDRIVFLRICEDRSIENYGQLKRLVAKPGIYRQLLDRFHEADLKYNSGLFHFRSEKFREETPDTLTPTLIVEDKTLRDIIKGLYYPGSPYEFSVVPADILGQVYEQFLGKVIRLTSSHRATVEEKPEVRKAGGVYYTPTYIVDYIVAETLGRLTAGKTPRQIEKLSVLDPACGSGSFLIAAYQYLLNWHLTYYTDNDPNKFTKGTDPALVLNKDVWRLTLGERKRILIRHIYGVDIDYQAVEVSKLSLLLKVLEGETEHTIQPTLAGLAERALPDLGNNIKCGNSLIGFDFYSSGTLPLDGMLPEKINIFDWSGDDGFRELMASGGFRVVIGNPPYIFARDLLSRSEREYFSSRYPLAWEKHNTYLLFMEALIGWLHTDGLASFIVPNSWLTVESGKRLRDTYVERVETIVDLNYAVFPRVSMEPTVFVTAGRTSAAQPRVGRVSSRAEFASQTLASASREAWRKNGGRITFSLSKDRATLDIIRERLSTIGSHFDVRTGLQAYEKGKGTPAQTAADVENHVYDADRKVDASTYKYLQGGDVGAFAVCWSGMWMRYGSWLAQPREISQFKRKRVLIREITGPLPHCLSACFVEGPYLSNKSILSVLHHADDAEALKVLACALNSSLMSVFYKEYAVKSARKLFPKVLIRNLREYPFPATLPKKAKGDLAILYDQYVAATASLQAAKPHEQDARRRLLGALRTSIDDAVYKLFGLSQNEVGVVGTLARPSHGA